MDVSLLGTTEVDVGHILSIRFFTFRVAHGYCVSSALPASQTDDGLENRLDGLENHSDKDLDCLDDGKVSG